MQPENDVTAIAKLKELEKGFRERAAYLRQCPLNFYRAGPLQEYADKVDHILTALDNDDREAGVAELRDLTKLFCREAGIYEAQFKADMGSGNITTISDMGALNYHRYAKVTYEATQLLCK